MYKVRGVTPRPRARGRALVTRHVTGFQGHMLPCAIPRTPSRILPYMYSYRVLPSHWSLPRRFTRTETKPLRFQLRPPLLIVAPTNLYMQRRRRGHHMRCYSRVGRWVPHSSQTSHSVSQRLCAREDDPTARVPCLRTSAAQHACPTTVHGELMASSWRLMASSWRGRHERLSLEAGDVAIAQP
jgi:hypothetical protein